MRKLSLIVLASLCLAANAAEEVQLPTPWGTTCTLEGSTYTFNGSWAGAGTWYGAADKSQYDYVYIKYSQSTGAITFSVAYNEVEAVESWGDRYYATTGTISASADGGVLGLKLDKTSHFTAEGKTDKVFAQEIFQVTLQDQGAASTLAVDGIYFATEQEYMNAIGKGGDAEEGNPVETIATFNKVIDWNNSSWATLNAQDFYTAKAGMKLRLNISDVKPGAQGHLCTSKWTDLVDATQYVQLSGEYFDFNITEKMLEELQANGCLVVGVGFTLTTAQLVDPAKIPNMTCEVEKADIKAWAKGESPMVRVNIKNHQSGEVATSARLILATDKYETLGTKELELTVASGETKTLTFDLADMIDEPGFYHFNIVANYEQIASYNIGYDPTGIESPVDAQADFDEFWADALAELASVAPDYKLTKDESRSTSKRNVYLVEMQSVGNGNGEPVTIRGYYYEPTADGTYPVIITQNGYDGGGDIWMPGANDNPDWIEFNLSVRGQLVNNRDPYKTENAFYGDWFAYNFGDKDSYYYRGAYLDVVRSIDFVMSRDKVQTDNVFMTGASQGGALTIAGAALDHRINAIAPAVQFLGDFPDYFQLAQWPAWVAFQQQTALGLSDDEMYEFLSYFDTKNLAPMITCPVITAVGLQDPVCPPHTNMAPYNNLTVEDKQYTINPFCQHETPGSWNADYMAFFKAHMSGQDGIGSIAVDAESVADAAWYNVYGQKVDRNYRGVVICKGKKFINNPATIQ